MEEQKVHCKKCSSLILQSTAEKGGGLCMRCYRDANGSIPSSLVSEQVKREEDVSKRLDALMEYVERGNLKEVNFTDTETELEELIEDLESFFDITIRRKDEAVFSISGKDYKLPISNTLYDYQIITASIYEIVGDTSDIYIWGDGSWLYRISDKEMVDLESKFGKDVINHKYEGDFYETFDKFKPGYCSYNNIEYPYYGSSLSVKKFISNLENDDLYEENIMYE